MYLISILHYKEYDRFTAHISYKITGSVLQIRLCNYYAINDERRHYIAAFKYILIVTSAKVQLFIYVFIYLLILYN